MKYIDIENFIEEETGMRRVHLMANTPFGYDLPGEQGMEWVDIFMVPSGAQIEITRENGAYHLRGCWPYRGVLDVQPEGWPKWKRFVCWALKEERVSKCVEDAAVYYAQTFARWPRCAYIWKLPKGVEEGVEVDGLILVSADWAPRGCVLVGG